MILPVALVGMARAGRPTAVVVPADGAFAIVEYAGGTLRVWRRDGGVVEVGPVELPAPLILWDAPPEAIRWVGVSADGSIAATMYEAGVVSLFDPRDGRGGPMVAIDLRGPINGPWTKLRVAQAPGSSLATCGNSPRPMTEPALSADGTRLLTVGYSDAGERVALWDTESGRVLRTWTSDEYVSTVGFAANGEPVIHAGGEIVVLGDVPRFVAHGVSWSRYEPATGSFLVHAPGGYAQVDPVSGTVVLTHPPDFTEREPPLSVTSADGAVRVVVSDDGAPRFESAALP